MMASPHASPSRDLQGASRVTGGSSRGHAQGNVFNFADSDNLQDFRYPALKARDGHVRIFTSRHTVKPTMTLKHKVTTDLGPVLEALAERYSPVRSKYHTR